MLIFMGDLSLGNSEGYFIVKTRRWADHGYFGVGIKGVEDATSGYLYQARG